MSLEQVQIEKATLLDQLLKDPATRKDALRLVKRAKPDTPIPEIDAEDAAEASIAAERAERAKVEEKVRQLEMARDVDEGRKAVMKKHDLSETELSDVEALLLRDENKGLNYDQAVRLYKSERVLATPTSANVGPPSFDMPSAETWKSAIGNTNRGNLDKVAMKLAYKAQEEFRSGKLQ